MIKNKSKDYAIIFDAGSSGTRANIFEMEPEYDCSCTTNIKKIKKIEHLKIDNDKEVKDNGLAKQKVGDIEKYFKKLFDKIKNSLKLNDYSNIPIYLMATAGMRSGPSENTKEILEHTSAYFSKTGFRFDSKEWVKILPGEFEGAFGWLTTNYLTNSLYRNKTVALIELGGGSMQIAFKPNDLPLSNSFEIVYNGTSTILYTHSYLKYGDKAARNRYISLMHSEAKNEVFDDTCFLKGYSETFNMIDYVKGERASSNENITMRGNMDFDKCFSNIQKLLYKDAFCPEMTCGINGVYQPKIPDEMEIYAISGYYYTVEFAESKGSQTLLQLYDKIKEKCDKNAVYDSELGKKDPFYSYRCFNSAYSLNLLKNGLNINENRVINFVKKINNEKIDWTYGAAIYELSKIDYCKNETSPLQEGESSSLQTGLFICLSLFTIYLV